jgi:hypothetical protein
MNVKRFADYIVLRNCDDEVTGTLTIHSCYTLGESMNFDTFLLKPVGGGIAVVEFGCN